MADLVTVPNRELMKVGKWSVYKGGEFNVTPELIQSAISAHNAGILRKPVIRLGHEDPETGDPAVGWVDNVRASDDGQTLYGDLVGVPRKLADIMPSAYPSLSIEGMHGYMASDGTTHDFVLTGLGLLGAKAPAISSLKSVQELYDIEDEAVAAAVGEIGGTPIKFTVNTPERHDQKVAMAALTRFMAASDKPYGDVTYADPKNGKYPIDTEEHVRAAWSYINMPKNQTGYSADELAAIKGRIKSAAKKFGIEINAASPAAEKKGAIVASITPEVAARLGIEPDADDETVNKALLDKLPAPVVDDAPDTPVDESPAVPEPAPQPVAAAASFEQLKTIAAAHGATVVDATVLAQLQTQAAAGEAARAQQLYESDERTLLDAMKSGKITAASAPKFRENLAKGGETRETTLTLLEALPENRAMAIIEAGHGIASEDTAVDAELDQISARITGGLVGKDA